MSLFSLLNILNNLREKLPEHSLALAIDVYHLIEQGLSHKPLDQHAVDELLDFVYQEIPAHYKEPEGTLTEAELQAVVKSVWDVYVKVKAITTH